MTRAEAQRPQRRAPLTQPSPLRGERVVPIPVPFSCGCDALVSLRSLRLCASLELSVSFCILVSMSAIHELELDWIDAIQGGGGWARLMIWVSYLGLEALPGLAALAFFLHSRKSGLRLIFLLTLCACVEHSIKLALHSPRPFWIDERIAGLTPVTSYSLPSGHAAQATLLWFACAALVRRWWGWMLAGCIVLFVSFSRVYLGVHFISDVVAGMILGLGILWAAARLEPELARWPPMKRPGWQFLVAVSVTALLLGAGITAARAWTGVIDPPSWPSGASRDLTSLLTAGGGFFGAACAGLLDSQRSAFAEEDQTWRRILALVSALLGAGLIYWFFRDRESNWGDFVFGWGAVMWVCFLAPFFLTSLGLLRLAADEQARSR